MGWQESLAPGNIKSKTGIRQPRTPPTWPVEDRSTNVESSLGADMRVPGGKKPSTRISRNHDGHLTATMTAHLRGLHLVEFLLELFDPINILAIVLPKLVKGV